MQSVNRRTALNGWPEKVPVVGTPISLTSYGEVLSLLHQRPRDRAATFAFCNVHSVMSARRDPKLAAALANMDVAASDGMPLVWQLRRIAKREQERVYGPQLMLRALVHGQEHGWKHYFYGSTAATLGRLCEAADRLVPGVRIVGTHSPPFGPLSDEEEERALRDIHASGADLVWVGLGMPKQELWVDRVRNQLPGMALLGVGAAFDFLSGTVRQAPEWMQRSGLEWLYRLAMEPRRMWRRYLFNNPAFCFFALQQVLKSGCYAAADARTTSESACFPLPSDESHAHTSD